MHPPIKSKMVLSPYYLLVERLSNMNYDEMNALLGECLQDTDKLPGNIDRLSDALKEQQSTLDALQKHIDELETKNQALRDDNYKLVLGRLHTDSNTAQTEEVSRTERVEKYAQMLRDNFN